MTPAHEATREPHEPDAGAPGLSIVCLDDDADFREFIKTLLESAQGGSHRVRLAADPEEFFQACEESLPDVVLLDMKMGAVDGSTVLGEIRKRWPKLCVIIVTGHPSLDSMRQTFKQDVFDYLAKPFSIEELRRSLAQAAATLGLGRRPLDRLRVELGRQIRLARTGRGWTLKELSEASGISVSQLSSIERASHLPSVESLVAIAEALEASPSAWFGAAGL
ncbi:MAG TPA: response regulator [Phycisphaerales bacterium]|nr:response regulator [Phycisphaerales bacterium]